MTASATKRQRGVAAVEIGLIAPLMMILLFAIVEFGLALWRKQILTSAVREGARKGVVATNPRVTTTCSGTCPTDCSTNDSVECRVRAYLTGVGWDASLATVTITGGGSGAAAGSSLTVTSSYPSSLQVISRLMPGTFNVNGSGNVTLTATVVMQME